MPPSMSAMRIRELFTSTSVVCDGRPRGMAHSWFSQMSTSRSLEHRAFRWIPPGRHKASRSEFLGVPNGPAGDEVDVEILVELLCHRTDHLPGGGPNCCLVAGHGPAPHGRYVNEPVGSTAVDLDVISTRVQRFLPSDVTAGERGPTVRPTPRLR